MIESFDAMVEAEAAFKADLEKLLKNHDSATQTWPTETDCVAGHVGLELRNVVANYAFEKSRRFAGNQPNSGHGDHSRLSCGAGDTQLGPGGQHPAPSRTRWSKDDPPAAKPATPLLSLRWTFRANRACVVITDAEPARLAPLTPPAPMGLRGVCVVAW